MDIEWTSEETPPPQEELPELAPETPVEELPELAPETLAAVRALQGGEVEESTRHLFETFEPQLAAYFLRRECEDFEADDLTQTVFIRMLELERAHSTTTTHERLKETRTMSAILTNVMIEAAVRLCTVIESHARDAGRQLGEWLRPWLRDGEELPDFTLVLQLPARMIEHAGHRLRESQKEIDESRGHEGEAQVSRNQTASALRRKLVETRRHLTAVFGSRRTAALLGIEGPTAKAAQPEQLLAQAEALQKLLRDPKRLVTPGPVYFVPTAAAASLDPLVVAFREAHGLLVALREARSARLEARDRARVELDRGIRCVASIVGGWLVLIRRQDLAKKVYRVQRPGKKAKNVKKAKK